MKTLTRFMGGAILILYAFGASTFSHMLTMNHPEMDMTSTIDHSSHENINTNDAHKKCVQTCEKIEKLKMSSLANAIIVKSITFHHISFPTAPLETIHTTPISYYYSSSGPPGDFTFSPLHLEVIASTVLTI